MKQNRTKEIKVLVTPDVHERMKSASEQMAQPVSTLAANAVAAWSQQFQPKPAKEAT